MAKCIRCKGHLAKTDKAPNGRCLICYLDAAKAKKKKTTNPAHEAGQFKTLPVAATTSKFDIDAAYKTIKKLLGNLPPIQHQTVKPSGSISMDYGIDSGGGYLIPPNIPIKFLQFDYTWEHPTIKCFSCAVEVKHDIYKETQNLCLACAMALIHKKEHLFRNPPVGMAENECFVLGCREPATRLRIEHWVKDGYSIKKHLRVCTFHEQLAYESAYGQQVPGPYESVEAGHQANPTEFIRKVDHE